MARASSFAFSRFLRCSSTGVFNDVGDCLGFISKHDVKWRFSGGGMRAMIVYKFGHGNMIDPCFRVRTAKDMKVGFNFLVELFCFTIGLRVIGSGE